MSLAAAVGLLLAAAGLFVPLAVGIPALGLNMYGRNPIEFTVTGEGFAAGLYLVGATLTWFATDWTRRSGRLGRRWVPGALGLTAVWLITEVPTLLRRDWVWAAGLLFFFAGLILPIALGLRPWEAAPTPAERKPAA